MKMALSEDSKNCISQKMYFLKKLLTYSQEIFWVRKELIEQVLLGILCRSKDNFWRNFNFREQVC